MRNLLALDADAEGEDQELELGKDGGADVLVEVAPCFGEC
jgi:hypothetical protein